MTISPSLMRSIVLSIFLSFIAPIILAIAVFASLIVAGCLPGLTAITSNASFQIKLFLAIFGDGCPFAGLITISSTCSLVGGLFDTYAFCRYQNLKGN
jgi:hypothetical protein